MIWQNLSGHCRKAALATELAGYPVHDRRVYYPGLMIPFPIPSFGVTHTLREACDERAEELIKKHGHSIGALFSGGADSTLAVLALVHAGAKLTLYMSQSAIDDTDPVTMQWLLDRDATVVIIDKIDLKDCPHFLITGMVGDQLYFGTMAAEDTTLISRVWEMTVDDLIGEIRNMPPSPALTARYEELFQCLPYEPTAPNIMHWYSFCYLWTREVLHISSCTLVGKYGVRHETFYDSVPLQQWAMQDAKYRCGRSLATYKDTGIAVIQGYIGSPVKVPQKNGIMKDALNMQGGMAQLHVINDDGSIIWRSM